MTVPALWLRGAGTTGLYGVMLLVLLAGPVYADPAAASSSEPPAAPAPTRSADGQMSDTLRELTPRLMALPGVEGAGEGRCAGKPCIKVLVREKTADLIARIRDIVGEVPVDIVETGEIRSRDEHD